MSKNNSTNDRREQAAAYARSSGDRQEKSCAQQMEWAQKKAAELGLDLVVVQQDEGIPGEVIDRPGLEAIFADLARRQKARRPVSALLLFDQDRLSRGTSWAAGAFMERLARLGVERVITASRCFDLYDDADRAIFGIEQDLGKRGYVKSMSRNVSRAMASLAALGKWNGGSAPYAYRIIGAKYDRHLIPGPDEEVEAIRALFREAARGILTTSGLARLANERGWPVPAASVFRQRRLAQKALCKLLAEGMAEDDPRVVAVRRRLEKPEWTAYTVAWLLRRKVYLGVIRYGGRRSGKYHQAAAEGPIEKRGPSQDIAPAQEREDCHEALVDRATWDRVQAVLSGRRVERRVGRRHPEDFAFSGRLLCDCCGGLMQGRHKGTFHGYVCGTWRNRRGCSRNSISEAVLLDAVASLLARELDKPATLERLRKQLESHRSECGHVQRSALEKGRRRVADLETQLEDGGRRLLSVSADLLHLAEKELRRLSGELATAKGDMEQLEACASSRQVEEQNTEELLARLQDVPRLLREADADKRIRVLAAVVEKITLRFLVRQSPSGRLLSRRQGGTVRLRGGRSYELPVPPGPASRTRRCFSWRPSALAYLRVAAWFLRMPWPACRPLAPAA
jgi:DNA invertase Pin-like site-specific DNA recombinase